MEQRTRTNGHPPELCVYKCGVATTIHNSAGKPVHVACEQAAERRLEQQSVEQLLQQRNTDWPAGWGAIS